MVQAGAYLSEAPFRCSTLGQARSHTHKHQTRLKRLPRDKHSSLLGKSVNYGRNKFYDTGPCCLIDPCYFGLETNPGSLYFICFLALFPPSSAAPCPIIILNVFYFIKLIINLSIINRFKTAYIFANSDKKSDEKPFRMFDELVKVDRF